MNRIERRLAVREMRERAKAWPEHLVPVPAEQWPAPRPGHRRPVGLWRSRHYLAQLFEEKPVGFIDVMRLTVNRCTRVAGGWGENIPWQDLMRCKREAGFGGWYGIEIYPRDRDVVNVANMRHLWLLSEPLDIGWFDGEGEAGI